MKKEKVIKELRIKNDKYISEKGRNTSILISLIFISIINSLFSDLLGINKNLVLLPVLIAVVLSLSIRIEIYRSYKEDDRFNFKRVFLYVKDTHSSFHIINYMQKLLI